MQITQMTVTHGRVINLGDYQTKRFEISMVATVESGDDLADVKNTLNTTIHNELDRLEAAARDAMKPAEADHTHHSDTEIKAAKKTTETDIKTVTAAQLLKVAQVYALQVGKDSFFAKLKQYGKAASVGAVKPENAFTLYQELQKALPEPYKSQFAL